MQINDTIVLQRQDETRDNDVLRVNSYQFLCSQERPILNHRIFIDRYRTGSFNQNLAIELTTNNNRALKEDEVLDRQIDAVTGIDESRYDHITCRHARIRIRIRCIDHDFRHVIYRDKVAPSGIDSPYPANHSGNLDGLLRLERYPAVGVRVQQTTTDIDFLTRFIKGNFTRYVVDFEINPVQ